MNERCESRRDVEQIKLNDGTFLPDGHLWHMNSWTEGRGPYAETVQIWSCENCRAAAYRVPWWRRLRSPLEPKRWAVIHPKGKIDDKDET